jgi:phosphoserine phosphatase
MNLIIQNGALPTFLLDRIAAATQAAAVEPRPPRVVCFRNASRTAEFDALLPLIEAEKLDWAFVPADRKLADYGLICFDMDSTLITIECIDEIADMQGLKPQVAEITEAAMRGELDFSESLRRRVALLAGLDESALQRVYDERLQLTPGAETLLAAARAAGLATLLVSGGFTFFSERLKTRLGLTHAHANTLEIQGGKLTGRVLGDIVDAQAKADWLVRVRDSLGLDPTATVAMGDGANDLKMLHAAGVGIAFHAKPVVRAQASHALNHVGLDGAIALLGG